MGTINKVSGDVSVSDSDLTVASPGGDTFENDERTLLYFQNSSGAIRTVTVHEATDYKPHPDYVAQPLVLSIPAGGFRFTTRRLARQRFGGRTSLTYDDAGGLSIVAIRLGGA